MVGLFHLHEGGGHTGGVVQHAADAHVVVVADAVVGVAGVVPSVAASAVSAVVVVNHFFWTLVGADLRHAPLCRGGTLTRGVVQGVVDHPVVVLLGATRHLHLLGDGAAVVPVVPCCLLHQRCSNSHLVDAKAFAVRAYDVVTVAVPLLVVVAGVARAEPHAQRVEAAGGAEALDARRVAGGVEGQVHGALLHYLRGAFRGVGASAVDFGPAVGLVEARQVLRVVGVALSSVEPVVVAIGEGVVTLGAQPRGSAAENDCQQY